ncbi:MAG TPA: hypothetical protein VLC91_00465 [Spongiibacteraceae bacterium]|nr:hypothetical protein [Spongiibacteraceae bacterium]
MYKLTLAAAVAAISSPTFAIEYYGSATSGTAANPAAAITVKATTANSIFYVDNTSSTASNTATPAVQLTKTSDWSFDFSNYAAVAFSGSIVYGDYKTQTNTGYGDFAIDGRQTFTGVTQSFSGVGSFDAATNTFTYSFLNSTVNGGGASVQTQTGASCTDGKTGVVGKICTSFASVSKAWEGLALSLVFSADKNWFYGALTGRDTSGSGVSANTTTINWQVSGITNLCDASWPNCAPSLPPAPSYIPIPTAAWLFGSSLFGLASVARRKSKSALRSV